jgi:hypothetical protein
MTRQDATGEALAGDPLGAATPLAPWMQAS